MLMSLLTTLALLVTSSRAESQPYDAPAPESWSIETSMQATSLIDESRRGPRGHRVAATGATSPGRGLLLWRGAESSAMTFPLTASAPFDRAVVSWNATGPVLVELEAGGRWHVMGRWSDRPRSEPGGLVDVDKLVLPRAATSFRFRVTPERGTTVTLVAVTRWLDAERLTDPGLASPAWGRTLAVPQRTQTTETDGGRVCSPTSLSMVLQHHGTNKSTREVALGVYDHAARIYGNWSFNVAYAHRVSGLEAYVGRATFQDLEAEIAAGRPVIISHNWTAGQLTGAPISATDGHIIVVVGFAANGDVVVNDPAAPLSSVRRTYRRAELRRTWLDRGDGIVYFLRPAAAR